MDPDDLTALEHTWSRLLPPRWLDSARAVYEDLPFQRYRQLPLVDVPYDHRRLEHWADAARVADFASLLPPGGRTVIDIGPGDGWPSIPLALGFLSRPAHGAAARGRHRTLPQAITGPAAQTLVASP